MINMASELVSHIQRFWASAEAVYRLGDHTSATILYFKCWFVLLDHILLIATQKHPTDHTERFRLLETHFPLLYITLDKYFPIYRDTYSLVIEKETCDEVRYHVLRIIKEQKIQV